VKYSYVHNRKFDQKLSGIFGTAAFRLTDNMKDTIQKFAIVSTISCSI
jgi:hypothetical protein